MRFQSKIAELAKLERVVLPKISDIGELNELQRRLNELVAAPNGVPGMETTV